MPTWSPVCCAALLLLACGVVELDPGLAGPADATAPGATPDAIPADARPADALPPDAEPPVPCAVRPAEVDVAPLTPIVIAGPRDARLRRWRWTIEAQPPVGAAVLAEYVDPLGVAHADLDTTPEVTFLGDRPGRYTLALRVDGADGPACPPIEVAVRVVPPPGLYAELRWAPEADLDLILTHPDGPCPASNTLPRPGGVGADDPDWDLPNDPTDDPRLLRTDAQGPGPEVMVLSRAGAPGAFGVGVRAFQLDAPTTATVSIWWDADLRYEGQADLDVPGDYWAPLDLQVECSGCGPEVRVRDLRGRWGVCR